jgi:hypothetical protein
MYVSSEGATMASAHTRVCEWACQGLRFQCELVTHRVCHRERVVAVVVVLVLEVVVGPMLHGVWANGVLNVSVMAPGLR